MAYKKMTVIVANCIVAVLIITFLPQNITDFAEICMFSALIALFDC